MQYHCSLACSFGCITHLAFRFHSRSLGKSIAFITELRRLNLLICRKHLEWYLERMTVRLAISTVFPCNSQDSQFTFALPAVKSWGSERLGSSRKQCSGHSARSLPSQLHESPSASSPCHSLWQAGTHSHPLELPGVSLFCSITFNSFCPILFQ